MKVSDLIWFKLVKADTFMYYLAKVKVEKSKRRRSKRTFIHRSCEARFEELKTLRLRYERKMICEIYS